MEIYYHSSNEKFYEFNSDLSEEIGLHVGSFNQAKERNNKYIHFIAVANLKTVELPDNVNHFASLKTLENLCTKGIITEEEFNKYRMKFIEVADNDKRRLGHSKILRDILLSKEYNAIKYINKIEAQGEISYALLKKEIIIKIEPIEDYIRRKFIQGDDVSLMSDYENISINGYIQNNDILYIDRNVIILSKCIDKLQTAWENDELK